EPTGTLVVEIADDGTGFDPDLPRPGHLGLHIMRERVELDNTTRRGDRYVSALSSYTLGATVADLYEIAAAAYDELWANITPAIGQALGNPNYHEFHLHILLTWGLRLDQLGYGPEATSRLRQADRIAEDWVRALTDPDKIREVLAVRALVLAKLGQV